MMVGIGRRNAFVNAMDGGRVEWKENSLRNLLPNDLHGVFPIYFDNVSA